MKDWSEQRKTVFLDRYALKDKNGNTVESSPEEMWARVANEIAKTEEEKEEFYNLLKDFGLVPGGRILAGAGTETEMTYYNCFVLNVEPDVDTGIVGRDSREAIFDTIKRMVDIMSRGGGVGINWSTLRPENAYLTRVSGTSSGPIGWMNVASTAVGEVIQGGSRRGAAMFMINDWHPDVLRFIDEKRDGSKITNANISVCISNSFMEAVANDGDWVLEFPDTTHPEYNKIWDGQLDEWKALGYPTKVYATMKAREIWRKIAEGAWHNGEPGIVFLERMNDLSTGASLGKFYATNPCGEQPLEPYSVCNLGAMNLTRYVVNGFDGDPIFDYNTFEKDVAVAVRFLDNVIDKTYYFMPETEKSQLLRRRIGLGVMGLADTFIELGIRYGSPESVRQTEGIFRSMKNAAIRESISLAEKYGPANGWSDDMWELPYLRDYDGPRGPMRNIFLLTQAPTGTTSILAGVNSGIEPYFDFTYTRTDRTGVHKIQVKPVEDFYRRNPGQPLPDYFVTSQDVTVEEHIAVQAAVQKYVDSSVSKTINAPNWHKVEDVERAYQLAWDSGLKGVAYFRDGCYRDAVLTREGKSPEGGIQFLDTTDNCPTCGSDIVREENCKKCYSCGWSAC